MSDIATPCIKVCALDAASGQCLGCGRTGAEIAGWISMTPAARDTVMAQLPARLKTLHDALTAAAQGENAQSTRSS